MRPPLLLLLLGGWGAAASPAALTLALPGSPAQLPAPQNVRMHLYNTEQVLSWDPVTPGKDPRPLVYKVEYAIKANEKDWFDVISNNLPGVNCSRIVATRCDFTPKGFPMYFEVSLRVQAEQGELTSPWATVPWFQSYRDATIGPPKPWVTPGEASLELRVSSPFTLDNHLAIFQYNVRYWEEGTVSAQTKGPFNSSAIVLTDLKPLREYCLQVQAQISWADTVNPGLFTSTSCHKTEADDATRLQQALLIVFVTLLVLSVLLGSFFYLFLRYRGLLKYWFHSPPSIPRQIREYLQDPTQPILEALEQDSRPKDDAWDSVSIVSFPEKEAEGVRQSTLKPGTDATRHHQLLHLPGGSGLPGR